VNIKEYIESGIIERFVMGETTDEQTREVMSYAKQYPEIQEEIEAVENALISLAEANSHQPKEKTKELLFDKIFQAGDDSVASPTVKAPISKVVTFNKRYLVAASVVLLTSVVLNLMLYYRLKESEETVVALNTEKQQFASILTSEMSNYVALQEQMNKINSMDVVKIKLGALKLIPEASAIVYYNTQNKEVFLHVNKLPAAPEDKQYQLWAIVDGKPVDAGVFDAEAMNTVLLKMKDSNLPAAFAVTIEKKGGSVNPTLDQMVLLGNVSS
jgi:anti-sigma-K factor RskA